MDLLKLAAEAARCFETATRYSGEPYVRTTDDAPEWVGGLVRHAHGNFMPDDWRYKCIRDALDFIAESTEAELAELVDLAHDFADRADVYNADLLRWVASSLRRMGYVDEAMQEHGAQSLGIALQQGQYLERREVCELVLDALRERLDEIEDEIEGENLN